MSVEFKVTTELPVSQGRLWDWHAGGGAFARLTPPWQRMRLPAVFPSMEQGARLEFTLCAGPLAIGWHALIEDAQAPYRFVDTQLKGPFRSWRHIHEFAAVDASRSRLTDAVEFSLPCRAERVGAVRRAALKEISRLFDFRHRRMREDLNRWGHLLPPRDATVLITGASGLIGSRLRPLLQTLGYRVRTLSRHPRGPEAFRWDPCAGQIDATALEGVCAVIHLAGENIASGRWTAARKERILLSRQEGTRVLVNAMRAATQPPPVLISSSGVNIYRQGGTGELTEAAPEGTGFLADVCKVWEREARRAEEFGTRVVLMRTGVVLDPSGGALGKLLIPFRLGLGGPVGTGKQAFPWIGIDDLTDLFVSALTNADWTGPVNAVAPDWLSQRAFSDVLGHVLRRPAILPLPTPAVKLLFGQMGEETLLADLPVVPMQALKRGYVFRHANLETALRGLLGR